MKKFNDFFIYWFWWKWRAKKYDKDTDKDRADIFKKLKSLKIDGYFYLGCGSVLKNYRDNDLTKQDLDFIASQNFVESSEFKKIIKSLDLKIWQEIFYEGDLAIVKYLYKNRTPFEVFVAKNINDKETTVHIYHGCGWLKTIDCPKIEYVKTNYGEVLMPSNQEKYIIEWYGSHYNKPLNGAKFDFTKNANSTNLKQGSSNYSYKEY